MDTRRRAGAGAVVVGHPRAMRWAMASALAIGVIAGPRPAAGLEALPNEDAARAMVLLLSLGQALAPKPGPAMSPAQPEAKPVPVAASSTEPAPAGAAVMPDTALLDTARGAATPATGR